jgi:hypothetical protein
MASKVTSDVNTAQTYITSRVRHMIIMRARGKLGQFQQLSGYLVTKEEQIRMLHIYSDVKNVPRSFTYRSVSSSIGKWPDNAYRTHFTLHVGLLKNALVVSSCASS